MCDGANDPPPPSLPSFVRPSRASMSAADLDRGRDGLASVTAIVAAAATETANANANANATDATANANANATDATAATLVPVDWSLPFPAVPPRRRKQRRKRSGWGPFRSVVRERSVDFNLTLDVQQLQQQVQHLEVVRRALRLRSLNLRHAPDGSLMQTVREYFRLFRRGYCVHGDPPRLAGDPDSGADGRIRESEQRAFVFSVMDERMDCGNGLYGPQVMVDQIRNYSTFLRYISFDLVSFDIVTAEDAVIVTTKATLRFQILRTTIAMIFPHILGNETLVARLVGQELEPVAKITFYFNANDKCERYVAELDFAALFFELLDDPRDVDILMGRALIADNSMFGIEKPGNSANAGPPGQTVLQDEDVRDRSTFPTQTIGAGDDWTHSHYDGDSGYLDEGRTVDEAGCQRQYADEVGDQGPLRFEQSRDEYWAGILEARVATEHARDASVSDASSFSGEYGQGATTTSRMSLASIVDEYFAVFSSTASVDDHGYIQPIEAAHAQEQWGFLTRHIARGARCGFLQRVGPHGLLRQWETLRAAFHVVAFHQVSQNAAMFDPADNSFVVRAVGEYRLQCTPRTLELIFPHESPESALGRLLLTRQLVVATDLAFYMAANTGKVTRVTERMDMDAALASIMPDPEARTLLLSRCFLLDGQIPDLLDGSGRHENLPRSSCNRCGVCDDCQDDSSR